MQFLRTTKRVSAEDLPLGLLPVGRTRGRAGLSCTGHGPHCPSPPGSTSAPLLKDKAQSSHPTGCELQLRLWGAPALQPPRVTVGRALSAEESPGAHLDSPRAGTPRQAGPGEGRGVDPQHRGPARRPVLCHPADWTTRAAAVSRLGVAPVPAAVGRDRDPDLARTPTCAHGSRASASTGGRFFPPDLTGSARHRGEVRHSAPSAGCQRDCSCGTGRREEEEQERRSSLIGEGGFQRRDEGAEKGLGRGVVREWGGIHDGVEEREEKTRSPMEKRRRHKLSPQVSKYAQVIYSAP